MRPEYLLGSGPKEASGTRSRRGKKDSWWLALIMVLSSPGLCAQDPPRASAIRSNPTDALEHVYVPPGTFTMGCVAGDGECQEDEKPSRRVKLTEGFWIGRTEVTVDAFRKFVAAKGYRTTAESDGWSRFFDGRRLEKKEGVNWMTPGFDQGPKHPVVHMSWYDA
ncbi:MAG: formylglycine-generating enzyme family protein [Vicinamibacteria bacterium]|nr:formylglycine-generating enzyme family protein [Vicinamibacteria bacterium]